MAKIELQIRIKGGMTRPWYDGKLTINVQEPFTKSDIEDEAFRILKQTSFPEISKSDLIIDGVTL